MAESLSVTSAVARQFLICCRRYCATSKSYKYQRISPGHVYDNLYPWRSRAEFVNDIEKLIAYHKDGLLVMNKPYGVPVHPPHIRGNSTVVETLSNTEKECDYSLTESLDALKKQLRVNHLSIIKSPERFTSGSTIMATKEDVKEKVTASMRRAKAAQSPPFVFWAVTTCIPTKPHLQQRVGIKITEVPEFNQKVPIIESKVSKRAMEKSLIKPAMVEMRTIAFSNLYNCALVELATSTNIWHFTRVFLAHQLSPVLGDSLYSQRVKMVLGKSVSISPFNGACYNPYHLSAQLCNRLQIPEKGTYRVPTHLHLYQVTLKGKNDIVLKTPPPPHFLWTLRRLNLISETESMAAKVQMVN